MKTPLVCLRITFRNIRSISRSFASLKPNSVLGSIEESRTTHYHELVLLEDDVVWSEDYTKCAWLWFPLDVPPSRLNLV